MLFCHVYCHQKANYSKHTAISTTGLDMLKSEICERIQLLQKGIINQRMLEVKAARKARPKNDKNEPDQRFLTKRFFRFPLK